MNCPQCGAENPEGAAFCNLCQTVFAQGRQSPSDPQQYVPQPYDTPSMQGGFQPGPYGAPPGSMSAPSEWAGPSAPVAATKGRAGSFTNTIIIWLIVLIVVAGGAVFGVVLLRKGGSSAGT